MFFTFQFFPGLFVPVRIFTFPSAGNEEGEHTVGIRDANSLNLYDLGIPIDSVRYVTAATAGTYNKVWYHCCCNFGQSWIACGRECIS